MPARPRPALRLRPDSCHVWLAWLDAPLSDTWQRRWLPLLTADERDRYHGFVRRDDREAFLVTRAVARIAASAHTGSALEQLRLTRTRQGKPQLQGASVRDIELSLAHTSGLVACAILSGAPVGIDVEHLARKDEDLDLVEAYFAANERADLAGRHGLDRRARFFQYWCLKEAYAKALGRGLQLPLDSLAFSFSHPPDIALCDARVRQSWQFRYLPLGRDHALALAMGRRPDAVLDVVVHALRVSQLIAGDDHV